jgi:malonyl-CoA/methylmalonyl-CoA synthetase
VISHSGALPLIAHAQRHKQRTAIVEPQGSYTYNDLLEASARVAAALLAGRADLAEERVAFQVAPGFSWVATQWGIWRAGGIAVPLPQTAPRTELEFYIDDTASSTVVFDAVAASLLSPIAAVRNLRAFSYDQLLAGQPAELPQVSGTRRAMILYTSGTTSRPKGVVTTHANIAAQISTLVEAWEWSADDRIVLCLPLHHVHGIINVLSCALWSGAACHMFPRFDAAAVWDSIASGKVTLFMAVPTVYAKLIAAWECTVAERGANLSHACGKLRLMVSGSAALPVSTLERWKEITGHTLLERYGMTEIGMALANPLRGERVPGSVGAPLPRTASPWRREPPARSKSAVRVCSRNIGANPRRRVRRSAMAGFALVIRRWSRMGYIAFLDGRASTSSKLADIKSPRWRLRKRCASIPP